MGNLMLSLVLVLSAGLFCLTGDACAQPREAKEYAVKVAFLYNFAKFVEWPASSFPNDGSAVNICMLGEDPFGNLLELMRGKTVGARKVAVRLIGDIDEIKSCHILFVSDTEAHQLKPVLDAARAAHTLTVSDMPEFARAGGMIALIMEKDKVRFAINAAAADRAGLRLSSQLLKLAVMVIE